MKYFIFIVVIILAIALFGRRAIPEVREETSKEWYARMLEDPRWERKRDRILKRDKYTCQRCGNKRTLQVHHLAYQGRPWEVPDSWLLTLCDKCHDKKH
jgi:5-methylcytosine-specific restriction endonuclease McrA